MHHHRGETTILDQFVQGSMDTTMVPADDGAMDDPRSEHNILFRTHHRIQRIHHLLSPAHPRHLGHPDPSQTPLRDKRDLDREERPHVVPTHAKLERTRPFVRRDLGDRPVERVRGGIKRPVASGVGDGRVGTCREGYRDDDVVEREVVVFEFVFNVDVACAVVGGGGPAIDWMWEHGRGE